MASKEEESGLVQFDFNDIFNVAAYSFMAVVGMILNTLVLIIAYRNSGHQGLRSRTNIHFLVFHLTIADSIISFVTMPLEAAWRFTQQWEADNISCKSLMVLRAFGYYLSSAMLVVICIDRLKIMANPLTTRKSDRQTKRAKLMVLCSWIVSLLLSLPQAFMFRKLKHPYMEFYQCTTHMVLESYSEVVAEGDKIYWLFYGMDPNTLYKIYHISFLFFVYFLPLCCLLVNYIFIIHLIRRRSNAQQVSSSDSKPPVSRREWKNLRMSFVQVASFAVFWAPYACQQAWMMFHEASSLKVSPFVTDCMLLSAVFTSCFNPLVYGAYYYKDFNIFSRQPDSIRLKEEKEDGSENGDYLALY